MTKESFFDIEFETPPPELELSVEMKCREVMNSNSSPYMLVNPIPIINSEVCS